VSDQHPVRRSAQDLAQRRVLPGNGNIVPVAESTRDAIKVAIEPYQLCDLELWSAPSGRPDLPDSGL